MSVRNSLKNKGVRRVEREARKAYQARLRALAMVETTIPIASEQSGEDSL